MLEQRQHLTSTNCLWGMFFCFSSAPEDPVPWEGVSGACGQLQYTLVCKGRGTAREVKHQRPLARVVGVSGWNHFRQVRWHGQRTQPDRALRQAGGELGPACVLLADTKTLSGLSAYTTKLWHGKRFLPVANWCGVTVTSCRSCHRNHRYSFCVPSLKDFVFYLHSCRN